MNKDNIKAAQNFLDKINENDRVIKKFEDIAAKGKESLAADGLAHFFTSCGNLGSTSMKNEIAKFMVELGITILKEQNAKFEIEIENL